MKSSVANLRHKRPSTGALFSFLALMLMGASSAWAANVTQSDGTDASSQCELTEQKQAMLSRLNEARRDSRQCGDQDFAAAEPLVWSCKLEAAAQLHSQDMAENDYFSHTDQNGVGIQQRVSNQDYRWQAVGENIAAGHTSVYAVVEGWLESPGHCQNIMNTTFTEMGMAKANEPDSRYKTYWTQTLGNPR